MHPKPTFSSTPRSVDAPQIPLWRQLQGAASLLLAVRDGQSMTAALLEVDSLLLEFFKPEHRPMKYA